MKKPLSHLLLLSMLVTLSACSSTEKTQVREVSIFEVQEMPIPNTLEFSSLIEGEIQTALAFETSGKVSELYVDIGDTVSAGQVLATVSGESEHAAYSSSQLAYQNALAHYTNMQSLMGLYVNQAQTTLEAAKVSLDSSETALDDEGGVVDAQLVEAQLALDYTELQKENLAAVYAENRQGLISALESSITQVFLISKDAISYLYSINDLEFRNTDLDFDIDSKFITTLMNTGTIERNINELAREFLHFENDYNTNIISQTPSEETLRATTMMTLELVENLQTSIQDMHKIVVSSPATSKVSETELSSYKTQLSNFANNLESSMLSQSNGQLVGMQGTLQTLDALDVQHSASLLELEKQIEMAQQKIQLLENSTNSSINSHTSVYELSQSQYKQALISLDAAKSERDVQVQIAKTSLDAAWSQMSITQAAYDKTLIKAPFSGVIAKRYFDKGSFVSPGQLIFEIADISNLELSIDVPSEYVDHFFVGQKARVLPEHNMDEDLEVIAEVTQIQPTLSETTGKAEVVLKITSDVRIYPGTYVTVELETDLDKEAILIPEEALITYYDQDFVYLATSDGYARMQEVKRGLAMDAYVEILSGLEVGDQPIISSVGDLNSGDPILIVGQKTIPLNNEE